METNVAMYMKWEKMSNVYRRRGKAVVSGGLLAMSCRAPAGAEHLPGTPVAKG